MCCPPSMLPPSLFQKLWEKMQDNKDYLELIVKNNFLESQNV